MKAVPDILVPSTSCIRVVSFMPLPQFAIGQDARLALQRRQISLPPAEIKTRLLGLPVRMLVTIDGAMPDPQARYEPSE